MSRLHENRASRDGSMRTTPPSPPTQVVQGSTAMSDVIDFTTSALQRAQNQWKVLFSGEGGKSKAVTPERRSTSLSTENSRCNQPWGDDLLEKQSSITRIYVANVNGIPLDAQGGQFDTVCRVLKEIQADVFCGQEHNIDTTQAPLRKILYDTASQHWERN